MSHLSEWLSYLGIPRKELSRRLGIAENCVSMAISNNSKNLSWLHDAGILLNVPDYILLDYAPDSAKGNKFCLRAVMLEAKNRLKENRRHVK